MLQNLHPILKQERLAMLLVLRASAFYPFLTVLKRLEEEKSALAERY